MANAAFKLAGVEPSQPSGPAVLPLGVAALDASLSGGGLPCGVPIELMGQGVGSAATSLALRACSVAQRLTAGASGGPGREWCAFVDPARSLCAGGVARAGVELGRLLVLRPAPSAIEAATLELLRAQAFAVVVVDLQSGLEQRSPPALALDWWQAMARAVAGTKTCLLLLTERGGAGGRGARFDGTLGLRLELVRCSRSALEVAVCGGGSRARALRVPWQALAADVALGGKLARAALTTAQGGARHA